MGIVLVLGALLLTTIVAWHPAAAQTITFTEVADTNTAIPGGGGANFRSFSSPSIDGSAVAFLGNDGPFFSGNDGVYIDVDGSLDVVADVNTQVPGGVSNFDSFDLDVSIAGTDVAFIGEFSPSGSGVYVSVDGVGFEIVADTDTQIPGGQDPFSGFFDASMSGGDVAFSGSSLSALPRVLRRQRTGLRCHNPERGAEVARRGYPAEFWKRVLELVEAGRTVAEVAAELEISHQTIYGWRRPDARSTRPERRRGRTRLRA